MTADEQFMRLAIETCREGIGCGQSPFGACAVRAGIVLAAAHNQVWQDTDITAHAEVVALRRACREVHGINLAGCTIYSTTEPCPMCFSACHWAGVDRIVYGASIADARSAGFNELTISNDQMKHFGGSRVEVVPGVLRDEAAALFALWASQPGRRAY